jgi:hypothetical protein
MKYNDLTKRKRAYIDAIIEYAEVIGFDPNKLNFTRKELRLIAEHAGWKWIPNFVTHNAARKVDRGLFAVPEVQDRIGAVSPGQETEYDMEQDVVDTETMVASAETEPSGVLVV